MNWKYKGQEYQDLSHFPVDCVGFIYLIKHEKTGRYYVGKKQLYSTLTKKLGKKELAEQALIPTRGRKATKKKVTSESTWKDYWGSSKEFQKFVKQEGECTFTREILYLCTSTKMMSYFEQKVQFQMSVLEDMKSFNDNIQGRHFKKDFL